MIRRPPVLLPLVILLLLIPFSENVAQIQVAAQRDMQAVSVLNQVIANAGGSAALVAIQDFTATGTITFNWAGEDVSGTVAIKGRGLRQFRMEATLSDGVRTWLLNNGQASKEADGTVTSVPYHTALNFESLTFPFAHLLGALQDASVSISYVGLETIGDSQVHRIHLQKALSQADDLNGIRATLSRKDFLIDSTTNHIIAIQEMVHGKDRITEEHPHEVRFSNYQSIGSVSVPLSIMETNSGQRLFTIQINQIAFNTGLSDSDFAQ